VKISSQSRTLLLDTNLLLLLFIGAKDPKLIPKAKTLTAFEESDYDLLAEVINRNFTSLVTTPHIMTEVSNLLGKERDDVKFVGREAMAEFLKKCREINEQSVILVDRPEFMRLGLTDVAIAVAAELPAFVLTADAPLYIHVSRSGLQVANFNHIRQGAWT
jgi:hypothetical protein